MLTLPFSLGRSIIQMYDYIVTELPQLIEMHLPVNNQRSLCGHSMGGHGALMIGLRNPHRYTSVSAFAPIAHPSASNWGKKAFTAYLGTNKADWAQYDSTLLLQQKISNNLPILIDQGSADEYYPTQLSPNNFANTAANKGFKIYYNLRESYDHSYYFVSSFIESHINFHATAFGL